MKRSQIILLGIAVVLSGIIYIPIAMNAKKYEKQTKEENKIVEVPTTIVENQQHDIPMSSYGQVAPNTELMVSFEVQGKLVQGDKRLKPGVSFRKGQLLYKIDATETLLSIKSRKMALVGVINQNLPDIALDFPGQVKKWETFVAAMIGDATIPELPTKMSNKEFRFWSSRNVLTEYYSIASLEERVKKYYYFAPFSGTVTEIYSEPGSIVNPGVQIAKIARTGEFELKVPVALSDLEYYKKQKTARFTNPEGDLMATGSIIRISDVVNQRTQSADIYYSVKPEEGTQIYNGLYLNVEIDFIPEMEMMALPRRAVTDGKVLVLEGTKLSYVDVLQQNRKPDTVYVTGLQNGQVVVTEQVGAPSDDIIYESVPDTKQK
ncbi:MAG: efflux RND transporter periplasmic adaptor subunit [bacterium]|nr:efflux RND transporter periplasmic adaptor subunit [bacterium]